jgi:hypothetical protein
MEALEKKKLEENIKNNMSLKAQLKEICNQIEDVFVEQENKKKNNELQYKNGSTNYVDFPEFNSFQSKINNYKRKILSKERELNLNIEYENIKNNESDFKLFASRLITLEDENKRLKKISKELNEQLKEANGGDIVIEKTSELKQKLESLKKDIELLNKSSKKLDNSVLLQNKEIIELQLHNQKVKSNIEFAKAQQQKEDNNKSEEVSLENIKKMKDSIEKIKIEKKELEENYNLNIKKQNKSIAELEQDIKILQIKIAHTKHDNKLNVLKLKEIKKIQDEEIKMILIRKKEEKLKEEKRKKEIEKRKKFLEFKKKFYSGEGHSDDESGQKKYYINTSAENHNKGNLITESSSISKNNRYSKNNPPFDIKFNPNSNRESREHTKEVNDTEYKYNNDSYNHDNDIDNNYRLKGERQDKNNMNVEKSKKKGEVINEIDNLKKDLMKAINDDDDMKVDLNTDTRRIIKKKVKKKKVKTENEDKNNMGNNENINLNKKEKDNLEENNNKEEEEENYDENEFNQNNINLNDNGGEEISEEIENNEDDANLNKKELANEIKISGNRNPFKMSSFKNS